jgi:hypothetical protein
VLHDESDRLTREQALKLYTHGSAWFSHEDDKKGTLAVGRFADLAVLTDDYFAVDDDAIRGLESVLTILGGRVVHAGQEFASFAPPLPAVSPDWSPVARFGGYNNTRPAPPTHEHALVMSADGRVWDAGCGCGN